MKEAAAEECAAQCKDLAGPGKVAESAGSDSYEACYAKCVAQETKEIAAERVEVRREACSCAHSTSLRTGSPDKLIGAVQEGRGGVCC